MAGGEIKYVGVDGCPGGWFSVGLGDGCNFEVELFPSFSELVGYYSDAKLILVDMPIGLKERGLGKRAADCEAQKIMGRRNATVFYPPSREYTCQLDGLKYEEAKKKATSWKDGWKGFAQAVAITPKIIEVDKVIKSCANVKFPQIRETHPEICFWALNRRQIMSHNKTTTKGKCERIEVLMDCETQTKEILYSPETAKYLFNDDVAPDDILDALAAAITAKIAWQQYSGNPPTLPAEPQPDCKYLPMEMVYAEPK